MYGIFTYNCQDHRFTSHSCRKKIVNISSPMGGASGILSKEKTCFEYVSPSNMRSVRSMKGFDLDNKLPRSVPVARHLTLFDCFFS